MARFVTQTISYGILVLLNKVIHDSGRVDHQDLISIISADIRQRIQLDYMRLSDVKFVHPWVVPNFCAMIENGLLETLRFEEGVVF